MESWDVDKMGPMDPVFKNSYQMLYSARQGYWPGQHENDLRLNYIPVLANALQLARRELCNFDGREQLWRVTYDHLLRKSEALMCRLDAERKKVDVPPIDALQKLLKVEVGTETDDTEEDFLRQKRMSGPSEAERKAYDDYAKLLNDNMNLPRPLA